jgi:hypothetical protein
MTNTSQIPVDVVVPSPRAAAARKRASRWPLLSAAFLLAASTGTVAAATPPAVKPAPVAPRTVIVQPSANAQFQQKMQQAQLRGQLQQAQVEQQNQQALSQNLSRPYADNPQMQQQTNQANAAQQRIDRARQQNIIDRYNAAPPPSGRVAVPVTAPPANPPGGGR